VDPDRSFERIYRRHRNDVYGSVLRDVRDPDEAEDVTQVAFLNAFRAMRRGDRPEKPRAWLLTIARNVVRRRATMRAGRPQEVALDPELLVDLDDLEGSLAEDICAALRRLTDAQREAIVLRELQGRSYAEIAEELGLSVAAVEALIFRARRALAEELELVDRVPTVQKRGKHGLLALPGLAKLGSFGFSFGRAGLACLVGCAVIATVPVGEGDASRKPAPVSERAPQADAAAAQLTRERPAPAKPGPSHEKKVKKHRAGSAAGASGNEATTSAGGNDGSSGGSSSPLPVELPTAELPTVELPAVELPPVEVPTVQVPQVTVPDVPLPPVPDPSDVDTPDLGSLTS
jgi:RNA polymerase sigma-70 factor, ECF subfamily